MGARLVEMSERDYRAAAGLSWSSAKTLLDSPAQYRWDRDHPRTTQAQAVGQLCHALVLEGTDEGFVAAPDWKLNTKVGKQAAADFLGMAVEDISRDTVDAALDGLDVTVLSRADWDQANAMAEAVLFEVGDLFAGGGAELSAFGECPTTGVAIKGRIDFLADNGRLIDFKTSRQDTPEAFGRSFTGYGYHGQFAQYLELLDLNEISGPAPWCVTVTKNPPYLVDIYEIPAPILEVGHHLAVKAREIYRTCAALDSWPMRPEQEPGEARLLPIPKWAYAADPGEVAPW